MNIFIIYFQVGAPHQVLLIGLIGRVDHVDDMLEGSWYDTFKNFLGMFHGYTFYGSPFMVKVLPQPVYPYAHIVPL